jgi:SpoVK/Ycf46/Vps4 family AAA+-type ATPase
VEEALTVVIRKDLFEKWGINEHFEKGITNALLVYGPPGTGKTMLCETIAAVLGKGLMKISSGELQSQVPGQTEKNIQKAFSQAKESDLVLMFDECDSILSDRNSVGVILAAEINCLLTEIERHEGVVVMTTNRVQNLDPALQRRIIAKIELSNPNIDARRQIWKNLLPPKMPRARDVDIEKLAKFELTGGEIKNCILLAARKAIARNKKQVDMQMFEEAVVSVSRAKQDFERQRPRQFVPGLGKVMD